MYNQRIAIIGGGLSGLYAAFLLEQSGFRDYVLLEARNTLGGRIVSASVSERRSSGNEDPIDSLNRFDLGPTWFWPNLQPQLDRVIDDLGLERFEQYATGDMVVEHSAREAPLRMNGYVNSPASMRLMGGTGALVDALRHRLDATRLATGQVVRRLRLVDTRIEVDSDDALGSGTSWSVDHVLMAMPPRLVNHNVDFTPPLPPALTRQWSATATWMAPHAKYVAIYDRPFWREQGLSGEARSALGPMAEIYDASMPGASAALFGFLALDAQARKRMPEDVLRAHCRAQLGRLFGAQAGAPRVDIIKDWATDTYTAATGDELPGGHVAMTPSASPSLGPWKGRLTGIASEWSPEFPGYLAGAIDAATRGVHVVSEFFNHRTGNLTDRA